ncbi:MAG: ribonuclease HII [Clostridia bacterium]
MNAETLNYEYEQNAMEKGYKLVCGIDEAGRGPLAGAVWAAAVVLPIGLHIEGLNDSKKLTEKKREKLFDIIKKEAIAYHIEKVDAEVIDEINILQATFLAMKVACEGIDCDYALVDGNRMPKLEIDGETIVKGDSKSPSIAAASILAKVSRDREMLAYSEVYPEYNFEKHKGYGTKLHYQKLDEFGASPIHRKTFLKKYYAQKG